MLGDPGFGEVAANHQERHGGLLAQLGRGHREPILLDVADDELRSLLGEPLGDDPPEALRGPGDDRHPALVAAAVGGLRER
jgi:hypothetical protein